jgi:hypothetical protein
MVLPRIDAPVPEATDRKNKKKRARKTAKAAALRARNGETV